MEYWDIYDIHRIKKNKTIPRGENLAAGDYHVVVHVCIFNAKGELLIQQRQSCKKEFPNRWSFSACGSALAGENSQKAAERELFEEIGLRVDFQNKRPHFTINYNNGFADFYIIHSDTEEKDLILQSEEVRAVKWASEKEILHMIENKEFVPFFSGLVQMIFQSRNTFGCLKEEV